MLELLRGWDLTKVQIGMVSFPDPPSEGPDVISIGCVEADLLVILRKTGEIVVQEYGTKGHVLWRVAENGARLLDALIIAARFIEETGSEETDFPDPVIARRVALECANVAGGREYLEFYEMLVGTE
jgi:hypothetical protein